MARSYKTKTTISLDKDGRIPPAYRKYVNYNMNPIELNLDYFGVHIKSNLKEIKRKYEALTISIRAIVAKRDKILDTIVNTETSPRSRYNRLLNKPNKTEEEHEQLYFSLIELEDKYNDLIPLERDLRDSFRLKRARFPKGLISFVYEELGEEMPKEDF
ncbi:hypothetical protein P4489_06660 [Heyndrickxia sporothermodurans]|uniref:hypothetical protein n=1 Tax=Heyndrickxia sporothermodurans TaxID=46224 RepID=UPI002E1C045A|nr:hypothetical protein [Heyndrickxia sporothermodurans]